MGPPLDHPIDETEYRRVFAVLAQDRADAIWVGDEVENITNRKLIVELAEENSLPAMYPLKVFVEAGGLMSYGSDQSQHGRQCRLHRRPDSEGCEAKRHSHHAADQIRTRPSISRRRNCSASQYRLTLLATADAVIE